jgi:hypothetical protein
MNNKHMLAALAMGAGLGFACAAHADMRFTLIDLPDADGAPDTMQYVYEFTDAFTAGAGFNLIYSPARYAAVQLTVPLDDTWFPSIVQPDAAAPLDGLLSYMTLSDSTAGPMTFTVTFTNVGTGLPGAQPYEFFDDSFNIVASGQTVPVPELPVSVMLAGGLPMLAWLGRKRQRRCTPRH